MSHSLRSLNSVKAGREKNEKNIFFPGHLILIVDCDLIIITINYFQFHFQQSLSLLKDQVRYPSLPQIKMNVFPQQQLKLKNLIKRSWNSGLSLALPPCS